MLITVLQLYLQFCHGYTRQNQTLCNLNDPKQMFFFRCCLAPPIAGSRKPHAIGKFVGLSRYSRHLLFGLNAFYFNSWSELFLSVLSSGFYRKLRARALWLANNDIDVSSVCCRSLFYLFFCFFSLLLLWIAAVYVAGRCRLRPTWADYECGLGLQLAFPAASLSADELQSNNTSKSFSNFLTHKCSYQLQALNISSRIDCCATIRRMWRTSSTRARAWTRRQ